MKQNNELNHSYLSFNKAYIVYMVVDFFGYRLFRRKKLDDKIKKLLFINLGLIGDLIIFRYVIQDLLKNSAYQVDILIADEHKFLFANLPNIKLITVKNYQDRKFIRGFYKIYRALKQAKTNYDLACHFRGYLGTGILATYLSGVARQQVGYRTAGFGFLLNKIVPWRLQAHESIHYLDIIQAFKPDYERISLDAFDDLPTTEIGDFLNTHNLSPESYVVIHATSRDSRKNIAIDILDHTVKYILEHSNLQIVFVGAPNEVDYLYQLSSLNNSRVLVSNGKISLFAVRALIARAKLFIGIDSSIAHLISGINIPKIILWHDLNIIKQWQPLGDNFYIIERSEQSDCTILTKYIGI